MASPLFTVLSIHRGGGVNTCFIGIVSVLIGMTSVSFADGYDRKDFSYRSYKPNTSTGFYTNKTCDFINIDHIVSLKDAYESGASSWGASKKKYYGVKVKYGLSLVSNDKKVFSRCGLSF